MGGMHRGAICWERRVSWRCVVWPRAMRGVGTTQRGAMVIRVGVHVDYGERTAPGQRQAYRYLRSRVVNSSQKKRAPPGVGGKLLLSYLQGLEFLMRGEGLVKKPQPRQLHHHR